MGFSSTASETLNANRTIADPPASSSLSCRFPLVRTNKFKYLPDVVTINAIDSLSNKDPTFLSDLLAWDKNVEEQQDFMALHMSPLTLSSARHTQQLETIQEEDEEVE
jgi:hypothetical protein